ncbi:phage holin [Staphylococcus haemolyticus]|uniref:phage holin n=1 Tax=Staphylococcus haemolyticus TaxID=1283 RepID=UPI000E74ECFE|nr:phage holin [Staphylococcus haemolyticus]QFR06394.1 phage holin [Staphylococcus haemolyticus]QFU26191.1 phage holin [Staphylococcus haemolyticus]
MNWKLRFKNKAVLTGLVGAVLLFIKQVTELFGLDLSTQLEQISGLVGAILTLLAGLGVIVDPTSKGLKDSGIAQTYSKPRDSKNPDEFVEWQEQNNGLTPELNEKELETYDTSQPFTNDTDEVKWDVAENEEAK